VDRYFDIIRKKTLVNGYLFITRQEALVDEDVWLADTDLYQELHDYFYVAFYNH
jgi:hypothetical protein